MPKILTITLNPALDITTATAQLMTQHKMRCSTPAYEAGGGGVNVSRAIKELGGQSHAFVALGGATGTHFRTLLDAAGIDYEIFELFGETRFSLTVMETNTHQHYRFVLPGPPQDAADGQRLLKALDRCLETGFDFVVASGTLAPGLPEDLYAQIAGLVRRHGGAFLLDTSGPALAKGLAGNPYLIKLDTIEARELAGMSAIDEVSSRVLARHLVDQGAAEVVIITLGDRGAVIASKDVNHHLVAPPVEVLSAVGAGDSFLAALTLALSQARPLEEACRMGVAAAASAVTTPGSRLCDRGQTKLLFEQTQAVGERV